MDTLSSQPQLEDLVHQMKVLILLLTKKHKRKLETLVKCPKMSYHIFKIVENSIPKPPSLCCGLPHNQWPLRNVISAE